MNFDLGFRAVFPLRFWCVSMCSKNQQFRHA